MVAKYGQDPAFDHQHPGFNLGLVPRPAEPGHHHRNTVMGRHVLVGGVSVRLVTMGLAHAGAQIVGYHDLRNTTQIPEAALVRAAPVRQALGLGGLGIGVVGGSEHGDEDLRLAAFPGGLVHHRYCLGRHNRRTASRRPGGPSA